MRIALETSCLVARNQTGISRYARELAAHLVQVAPEHELSLVYMLRRIRRRQQLPKIDGLHSCLPWLGSVLPMRRFDLCHAVHRQVPCAIKAPLVMTLHDLYAQIPHLKKVPPDQVELDYYESIRQRADLVICVSENTRKDFLEHYRYPPERVFVTHLGVHPKFQPQPESALAEFRVRHGLQRPYLLFVGNVHPNKNLRRSLMAYAQSAARHDYAFVLVGRAHGEAGNDVNQWIAEGSVGESVQQLGSISEADLPLAYAAASALIFPSLYEGFGLPILEAMASGTAVLTSRSGSCPEVANGHAVLVDPFEVSDIAKGIDAVVQRSATALAEARHYANSKTWAETARKTLAVYQQAFSN